MSRKKLFRVVATAAVFIILSAVGTCAFAESVELDFWFLADMWTEPYEVFMNEFKEDMLEKHDIKLIFKTIPSANLDEMFITSAMSKKGYDITSDWQGPTVALHVEAGNYMALDEYFSEDEYGGFITYNDLRINGKAYVMPLISFPNTVVYNKALFREAGLDPDHFPRTWGGFLKVCEELKAAGITPLVFGNKEGYANEVIFNALFSQAFDSVEQEIREAVSLEGKYANPSSIELMNLYKDLYDKGYFMEGGMSSPFEEYYVAGMVGDKAAILLYGAAAGYSGLKAERGIENAGMAAHPIWADGLLNDAVTVLTHTIGISPWTKHPEESVIVVKELLSSEYQTKALLQSETIPTNPDVDMELIEDPNIKDLLNRVSYNSTSLLYALYSHPVWQAQAKNLSLFLLGEMTAEEALTTMDEAKSE